MGVGSTDIIVFWPKTNASIPSGWSEDTDFSTRFFQGSSTAEANGGHSGSHSHTEAMPLHVHSTSHTTHTINATGNATTTFTGVTGASTAIDYQHFHLPTTISGPTSESHSSVAITTNSTTPSPARPPYMDLIALRPSTVNEDIPVDGVVLLDNAHDLDSDFSICDGLGGTVNLDHRFIRAPSSGGDGGATGGTTTHTHGNVGHSHTYTHTHATPIALAADAGSAPLSVSLSFLFGGTVVIGASHHDAVITQASPYSVDSTTPTIDAASNEPAFMYLLAIQHRGASAKTPEFFIVPYTGDVGDIPEGYELCDGLGHTLNLSNVQIKCTVVPNQVAVTGGSNTHVHSVQAHAHTDSTGHNHAVTLTTIKAQTAQITGGAASQCAQSGHSHATVSVTTVNVTFGSVGATLDSQDVRSLYRTCHFIKRRRNTVDLLGCELLGQVQLGA